MSEKEYKLEIDPKLLKFLGPSLYTNIYYVLSELIANAWDADAKNVHIIYNKEKLIVEDDGIGMSYSSGDINKYLKVAEETRISEKDSYTTSNRMKMGRKGVGKLSALAVSSEVHVLTCKNGEKSGFILAREIGQNGLLPGLKEETIQFTKIEGDGTSIIMFNPEYKLDTDIDVVKNNISKMFPVIGDDFKIHIYINDKYVCLDKFSTNVISELDSLIILGDHNDLVASFKGHKDNLILEKEYEEKIDLQSRNGKIETYNLVVKGWIGTYITTRNRKKTVLEFPDNHLSIFSNGKMGEFNILPRISQNKLNEVYIVGQLYVDLFEETSLPDMALSNRQGYKSDDLRYIQLTKIAQNLLKRVLNLKDQANHRKNKDKKKAKLEKLSELESKFKRNVIDYNNNVKTKLINAINFKQVDEKEKEKIELEFSRIINSETKRLGIKPKIDSNKKRILISHTSDDKNLADTIYEMLIYNNVAAEDIIHYQSMDEVSRIPEGVPIYEYLRTFFVDSYSDEKIYVIFVTSHNMAKSWGAIIEVGASWITRSNHKIFNIADHIPSAPLDNNSVWHESTIDDEGNIYMTKLNVDIFCQKIETICNELNYSCKDRNLNMNKLKTLVTVID